MTEPMPATATVLTTRSIDWLLVLSLATLPLLQSLFAINGWAEALGRPQTPLALAVVITVLWVLVVGFSRTRRPVVCLLLAGGLAAVIATALSLLVPAMRTGDASNLRDGFAVIAELFITAALFCLWGALAGLLAAGVQRVRGRGRRA